MPNSDVDRRFLAWQRHGREADLAEALDLAAQDLLLWAGERGVAQQDARDAIARAFETAIQSETMLFAALAKAV